MITLRYAEERGHAHHDWLDSRHTFSFGEYYDPAHMGFRALRVLNDDRLQPGKGFGAHSHRDMEIISYGLSGGLQHRDSLGNGSIVRPGDVQRMSAGTGVIHSEFNASQQEVTRFLQIWLLPSQRGISPSYEQKTFPQGDLDGRLRLVASPDGCDGSVSIHTDARVHAGRFGAGVKHQLAIGTDRHAWVQIARGNVRVNGHALKEGDGAALSDIAHIDIQGVDAESEVLVFDLA